MNRAIHPNFFSDFPLISRKNKYFFYTREEKKKYRKRVKIEEEWLVMKQEQSLMFYMLLCLPLKARRLLFSIKKKLSGKESEILLLFAFLFPK